VLPGAGATLVSLISWGTEKKISKNPEKFGKGYIKGIAAPETANNAAAQGAFVPLLTLGIPGSGTTAIMLGALMVMGITPGPLLMQQYPDLFWGVIASMIVGNIFLLIINIPLVPLFAKILKIPYSILMSMIMFFCFIGVYSLNFSTLDIFLVILFGLVGLAFRRFDIPPAPMILAVVLGPLMEQAMRQAMTMSRGNWSIFVTRPISLGLLLVSLFAVLSPIVLRIIKLKRKRA